jgi:predicted RNase H-like HicB family nuclease
VAYTSAIDITCEDYKTVLYRQENGSWVAETPAIPGCYALMSTPELALTELPLVFSMIAEEHTEKSLLLPSANLNTLPS